MTRVLYRQGERGAVLLTVVLLLATIAALAFGLNRAAGMDVQSVTSEYDRRSAGYLAEGALQAARWYNEINANKCGKENLPAITLAGFALSATVNRGASKRLNIVATATNALTGASATLTRNEVDIFDLTNTETKDLAGAPRDTYVILGQLSPVTLSSSLALSSGQAHALLYWGMNDIPANSAVLSARLSLTQNGSSATERFVEVHRMTSQWDTSATWKMARSGLLTGSYWASATTLLGSDGGGDYSSPVLALTRVTGAGTYAWDVSGLVDGWVSGRLQNYGMLLRLQDPNQDIAFYSMEASNSGQRPALRVTFSKPC